MSATLDAWLAALEARHRTVLAPREFLKAVRALSARYVERRAALPVRSAFDSAGKRAAFAAFYAVEHLLAVREIAGALDARHPAPSEIIDLGCGTGTSAAGWALGCEPRPRLTGIDTRAWALAEARWNWARLGLAGRTRQADLVSAAERLASRRHGVRAATGIILGWSTNELHAPARGRLLSALLACAASGSAILVIEPLARAAAPWWDAWAGAVVEAGGRADSWSLDAQVPEALDRIRAEAGFSRRPLGARTLYLPVRPARD